MKAQLSVEFLIITAVLTVSFLILTPAIMSVKKASDLALAAENAKSMLENVYYACERAKITGEPQAVKLSSLSECVFSFNSTHVSVFFENKSVSKEVFFECNSSFSLEKGVNEVILR